MIFLSEIILQSNMKSLAIINNIVLQLTIHYQSLQIFRQQNQVLSFQFFYQFINLKEQFFYIFLHLIMQLNQFQKKYKKLNLLGKGNYGQVFKVKINDGKEGKEAKYYVAKMMYLGGLSEDQVKAAFGQIEILELLNKQIVSQQIPFIVTYKQFFRFDNELIIIMEYCQSGDLSNYIKNLKKNNQRMNEKIIIFWFIQLLFGIKTLHSKNVLHRDLKSANIFLTKNLSLKIGDFGISKVLEGSSAITCIGTPLYLSPEVCNNKPYGLSSDLWALGCILYEMCTLRYPFEASNMLVLAKKIVMDEVQPIPSHYSKQLNDIVMKMFIKDNKQRITIDQIMKTPLIVGYISQFVKIRGKIEDLNIPFVIDLPNPSIELSLSKNQSQTSKDQEMSQTINSVFQDTKKGKTLELSGTVDHKTRMRLKKEEENLRNQEVMKKAALEKFEENSFAREQKKKNLMQTGQFSNTQAKSLEIKFQNQNKMKSQIKFKAMAMEKNQTINLKEIYNTLKNISIKKQAQFQQVPLPGNSSYIPFDQKQTLKAPTQTKTTNVQKTKQKEIPQEIVEDVFQEQELQQYYDADFQEYYEEDELQTTKKQQDILAFFEHQLGVQTISPTKKNRVSQAFKPVGANSIKDKIKIRTEECQALVGAKRFAELSSGLRAGKINIVKDKVKYTKQQKEVLFKIEQIMNFQLL